MIRSLLILPLVILCACDQAVEESGTAIDTVAPVSAAASPSPVPASFDHDLGRFGSKEGVVGVFEMGTMLALSITDSAAMQQVAEKTARAYRLLEEDLNSVGVTPDGPFGQISYTNNPDNFKFECILLINKIPEKQPEHSKIVLLEASHMLVYNHYGPYKDLYKSYAKIRQICAEKGFEQSAPVREFYITDPTVVKDPAKWLTRILLPVMARSK